eukprot:COSAG06_NODE_26635_length_610_cov_1.181996_1_plen_55_part_10
MFSVPASALVWKDGPWGEAADRSGHVRPYFCFVLFLPACSVAAVARLLLLLLLLL